MGSDETAELVDPRHLGQELEQLLASLPAADRERMAREVRLLLDVWRPKAG